MTAMVTIYIKLLQRHNNRLQSHCLLCYREESAGDDMPCAQFRTDDLQLLAVMLAF